jgi:hypothetical protein
LELFTHFAQNFPVLRASYGFQLAKLLRNCIPLEPQTLLQDHDKDIPLERVGLLATYQDMLTCRKDYAISCLKAWNGLVVSRC